MVLRLATVALVLASLAGCVTTKGGNFCQIAKPIYLSHKTIEGLSDAEVKQALAYLKKGQALCGWHPSHS